MHACRYRAAVAARRLGVFSIVCMIGSFIIILLFFGRVYSSAYAQTAVYDARRTKNKSKTLSIIKGAERAAGESENQNSKLKIPNKHNIQQETITIILLLPHGGRIIVCLYQIRVHTAVLCNLYYIYISDRIYK